jgi:hypothetical protein
MQYLIQKKHTTKSARPLDVKKLGPISAFQPITSEDFKPHTQRAGPASRCKVALRSPHNNYMGPGPWLVCDGVASILPFVPNAKAVAVQGSWRPAGGDLSWWAKELAACLPSLSQCSTRPKLVTASNKEVS